MDILAEEDIKIECMMGHGGLFKSDFTAKVVSAAVSSKVATMSHAGEGGAWGIALLALFAAKGESGILLEDYMDKVAFSGAEMKVTEADEDTVKGFSSYMASYKKLLLAERAAVENL
jgi:sugar (pentulose or hexulose) kinase